MAVVVAEKWVSKKLLTTFRKEGSMRFQETEYSCGAASVVNALRALGKRVTEREVRKLADTDHNGTDEVGVMQALRAYNYQASEYISKSRHVAWRWLCGAISQGSVAIICVDQSQHWVVVIAIATDRVILIDSSRTQANIRENGIHVLSKNRLMARWKNGHKPGNNIYEAICVSKSK